MTQRYIVMGQKTSIYSMTKTPKSVQIYQEYTVNTMTIIVMNWWEWVTCALLFTFINLADYCIQRELWIRNIIYKMVEI